MPEHDWDVNLEALNDLIDDKTAAVMINNPSNPCGEDFLPSLPLREASREGV